MHFDSKYPSIRKLPIRSCSTSTILVYPFSHIFHAYFIRNEIVLHFWVKSFSQFRLQPVVFIGVTCNNKTGEEEREGGRSVIKKKKKEREEKKTRTEQELNIPPTLNFITLPVLQIPSNFRLKIPRQLDSRHSNHRTKTRSYLRTFSVHHLPTNFAKLSSPSNIFFRGSRKREREREGHSLNLRVRIVARKLQEVSTVFRFLARRTRLRDHKTSSPKKRREK